MCACLEDYGEGFEEGDIIGRSLRGQSRNGSRLFGGSGEADHLLLQEWQRLGRSLQARGLEKA